MKAILTYHSIDSGGSPVSVDAETLDRHIAWMRGDAVRVVPLAEIESAADGSVAVTFDDAFENFDTQAWPRFRDAGLPVTLFVVTGHVGGDNAWGGAPHPAVPTLPLLGWDALGRLAEEGVELGAHSRTHASLPQVDDARLQDELEGSRSDLETRCGRAPESFAYPYGAHDRRTAAAAGDVFARSVTTDLACLESGPDRSRLPRLDAWYLRAAGRIESFGTFGFGTWLRLRRAARFAGRVVRGTVGRS